MTDTLAGLSLLANQAGTEREHALRAFYEQWQHDRQVVDKWLMVQALSDIASHEGLSPDVYEIVTKYLAAE